MSEPVPPAVAAAPTKSADPRAPLKPCNNKRFHGQCWTKGKDPDRPEAKAKVVEWAKKEYTRDDRGYRLTLWTDAAVHQTNENSTQEGGGPEGENCSSAVVYRNQLNDDEWEWVEETLLHDGVVTIRFGELSAVLLALRRALQIVSSPAGAHITSVAIYSDNLRVVEWIRDYRKGAKYYEGWSGHFRAEMAEVVDLTNSIRRIGVEVEIAWIPGHEDIEGNMLADYIARRTAGTLPEWPKSEAGIEKLLSGGIEAYEKREKLVADRERAEQVFAERDEARKNRSSCRCHQTTFPYLEENKITTHRTADLPDLSSTPSLSPSPMPSHLAPQLLHHDDLFPLQHLSPTSTTLFQHISAAICAGVGSFGCSRAWRTAHTSTSCQAGTSQRSILLGC